jgi:CBS domain-containing protein
MNCKDVMTADPKCCLPDDTIARAAEIMREEDVGPVPVVSDRNVKRLAGIVTDRDIAIKVVAAGRDPRFTRVDEVMSKDIITCNAEDDYIQALQAMARHQVRRIPIVNEDGALLGIISQADVARRTSEEELGEVVEEISEPTGLGHALGSLRAHPSRPGESGIAFGPNTLLMGAACLSVGAGLMYLLDPNRGRSRRAIVRDKAASLYRDSAHYAGKVQRDLRNRAAGVAAGAKAKLTHEDEVADQKLEARVRTKLGRVTSHPHAIRVRAENGCLTLEGTILANEVNGLVSAVRSVPGVSEVENRLQTHEEPGGVPDLQGVTERPRERSEFMQANWSPTARLVASALGGGLVFYGLRAHGPLAKATATVGAGLLARGISNKEVASWTDLSAARRALGL